MVTTESVPGKICKSVGAQFPAMALPAAQVMKIIADAAARATRTIRAAAAQAGANAVVGLRTSTFVSPSGAARLFMYRTLARCE